MINETEIRVRYGETDQMGIVYHANYFIWFDIGRTEFFRKLEYDYKSLEDENVLLPVIDVNCKYHISAKYDDKIIIQTKVSELKGVRLQFDYKIIRVEDNELLAEGYTKHAFVDKNLKPIKFKRNNKEVWEKLVNTIK